MSWSGKRAGGGWEEPVAKKKKKESKTERILRQAKEQAEAAGNTVGDKSEESKVTLISDGAAKRASESNAAGRISAPAVKVEKVEWKKEQDSAKRRPAETNTSSSARHQGWERDSNTFGKSPAQQAAHVKYKHTDPNRGNMRDDATKEKEQPREANRKVNDSNDDKNIGGSGKKKKESKVERLKRQMAEQDGQSSKPMRDEESASSDKENQRKDRTLTRSEEKVEDNAEEEIQRDETAVFGGWAAAAEAEGLFDEGEGLLALASSKEKHAHKPVSGAQKQALMREVIPQWMKTPLDISATPETAIDSIGLDPRLLNALEQGGYKSFFPVQAAVVSQLLCSRGGGDIQWSGGRDVCVCAPTGSGKTLAFCVPIVQTLMTRVVPRLRALIVVPSRDLAAQVYAVMASLCACCDLRPCLAAGQVPYAEERAAMLPHCDIVVATPGRLTEHLLHTPHFTVQHLRFLVMDEADRLLSQSYQGWIPSLLHAVTESPAAASVRACEDGGFTVTAGDVTHSKDRSTVLRKLLFSATLTRNPSKLAPLRLIDPVYFAAKDARYQTPKELKEFMVPLGAGEKPLALIHLLEKHGFPPAVCFTNSLVSAHRLYRLLEIYGLAVHLFSSELPQNKRSEIVRGVTSGQIKLVVCSDAMARGMDLPQVEVVVNYDSPTSIKTYVHRVGRTARAGREGVAYTLLQSYEVKPFKALLRLADNNYVRSVRVGDKDLDQYVERYKQALQKLKIVLDRERWRELDVLDAIEALPTEEGFKSNDKETNPETHKKGGRDSHDVLKDAMRKRILGAYGL